jgi:hypothetical protein
MPPATGTSELTRPTAEKKAADNTTVGKTLRAMAARYTRAGDESRRHLAPALWIELPSSAREVSVDIAL